MTYEMTDKVKAIINFVAAVYQLEPGDIPRGTHRAARTTHAQQARDAACWLINSCTNISAFYIAEIIGYSEARHVMIRIDKCIERRRRGIDKYAQLFDEYAKCINDYEKHNEKHFEAKALKVTPQYSESLELRVATKVTKLVCETFSVKKYDLFSTNREYSLIRARFALAWILRTVYRYTLQSIGNYMEKDHSTVINAIQQFNNMIEQNKRSHNSDVQINIILEYANRIKQQ